MRRRIQPSRKRQPRAVSFDRLMTRLARRLLAEECEHAVGENLRLLDLGMVPGLRDQSRSARRGSARHRRVRIRG